MNKIKVVNDNLEVVKVDKNINVEYFKDECLGIFAIDEIKLNIKKSCDLELELELRETTKLNFDITLNKNVNLNLNIITNGISGKIQYKYNLNENSYLNVIKFQNVEEIKEMIIVKLNGINSKIDYNFKTISKNKETYDYHIFHENLNTTSNIKNNGICIKDGNIIFQVSSFVPKDIEGCLVNQANRIINLTNNKSEIRPNLYIDCNDTKASHSALIGKFSDEELFYLLSRCISYDMAVKLLIKGFLTSDISNKKIVNIILKNINKYWG